jgi:hypothetical protein
LALAGIILGGILVVLVIGVQLHRTAGSHVPHKNSGAPAVVMTVEPQGFRPIRTATR